MTFGRKPRVLASFRDTIAPDVAAIAAQNAHVAADVLPTTAALKMLPVAATTAVKV